MVRSMTGYGRGECEEFGRSFIVEIKTVNHRYSDISIKLPRQLSYLEDNIRKLVLSCISRGKIDVYVSQVKYSEEDVEVSIDTALTSAYLKALYELRDEFKLEDDITVSMVSRFPDILNVTKIEEENDEIWNTLKKTIDKALNNLMQMREAEGQKLIKDITERGEYIRSIIKLIEERSPLVIKEYKVRLEDRIKEIIGDINVDESRIAAEVAIFADRCSINEEIVRMYSHLDQLITILKEQNPVGRKLDFLVQEMNREINTIGSKANDIIISRNVVEVKSEIEKIREQIQNIE